MTAHTWNGMHGKSVLEWKAWLAELGNAAADLLFPPYCVSCRRFGAWLCPVCLDQIERIRPPVCLHCGMPWESASPLNQQGGNPGKRTGCRYCEQRNPAIDRLVALAFHNGPLRVAIHQLKYRDLRVLAVPLGKLMSDAWIDWAIDGNDIDVIAPIPLHPKRLRERGYNQSALLARELGQRLQLPVVEDVLVRTRATAPQVGLDAHQRQENVRDAFRCVGSQANAKRVLLVDDVCTTGATLEAAAVALRDGGTQTIWAYTLARAKGSLIPDSYNPNKESGKWN